MICLLLAASVLGPAALDGDVLHVTGETPTLDLGEPFYCWALLFDLPPPDDVYGPIRRAWLACRKSRYCVSDIAEDRSNALAALWREDETRRRRAEMTAARQVLSRPSSRASSPIGELPANTELACCT